MSPAPILVDDDAVSVDWGNPAALHATYGGGRGLLNSQPITGEPSGGREPVAAVVATHNNLTRGLGRRRRREREVGHIRRRPGRAITLDNDPTSASELSHGHGQRRDCGYDGCGPRAWCCGGVTRGGALQWRPCS